ncbi:MAG: hypothetical protein AABW92_04640 [Nanoarchaeota archaeon]
MGDPIKEKLKQERIRPINIHRTQSQAEPRFDVIPREDNLIPREDNLIRRMHNVNAPSANLGDPSLGVIDHYVKRINKNQKGLEKIAKMDSSPLYRGLVNVTDSVLGIIGKQPTRNNIYNLFIEQQDNVRNLNYNLASMVDSYSGNLEKVEFKLYDLLGDATTETLRRQKLKDEIPPDIKKYETVKDRLSQLNKDENPKEYYKSLKELINAESAVRKQGFNYNRTSFGKKHYENQIDNLKLQKTLFEMTLYRVMEMAVKTEFYQQALDNNFMAWQPIIDLANVVGVVSDGVVALSEYNKQLNDTYIKAVRDISEIVDEHPGIPLLVNTNNDLKQLVSDVGSNNLRNALQYRD